MTSKILNKFKLWKTVKTKGRIVFLGILFGGPIYNSEGKIVIKDIPTRQEVVSVTPQMINLGYYNPRLYWISKKR